MFISPCTSRSAGPLLSLVSGTLLRAVHVMFVALSCSRRHFYSQSWHENAICCINWDYMRYESSNSIIFYFHPISFPDKTSCNSRAVELSNSIKWDVDGSWRNCHICTVQSIVMIEIKSSVQTQIKYNHAYLLFVPLSRLGKRLE